MSRIPLQRFRTALTAGRAGDRPAGVCLRVIHRRRLKAAQGQREVSLLACSAELSSWTACRIVSAYRRRMQIEESFRDLKSHQYGHAFEDSQTRKAQRLEVLLLIHTLAVLAALLIGRIAELQRLDRLLLPHLGHRRCYPVLRIGWELAARGWIGPEKIQALSLIHPLIMTARPALADCEVVGEPQA